MQTLVSIIFLQLCISGYNVFNAHNDAIQIKTHKPISHRLNLRLYVLATISCLPLSYFSGGIFNLAIFPIAAFTNRQLFFDIALNVLRGLPWDYLPLPSPNGAWWDKVEYKYFGKKYNWLLTLVYLAIYITCLIILL